MAFDPAAGARPSGDARATGADVDWSGVHATTRTRATVATFGWRTKAAMTAPPFLVIGWWVWTGALLNPLIGLCFGVPMLAAATWWTRQVWVAGPAGRARRGSGSPSSTSIAAVGPVHRPVHPSMAYLYEEPAGPAAVSDLRAPAPPPACGPGDR